MIKIFVFDTNALISANLLPGSINRQAYDKARKIGMLVYSEDTFTEFSETFYRPKFEKYISEGKRRSEISAYEKAGQLISISATVNICRDPKDNKFLELAIEANAACIITGDKDLLELHPFKQIPILTASDFLDKF